jgi:AraC-like DNA-binding protein
MPNRENPDQLKNEFIAGNKNLPLSLEELLYYYDQEPVTRPYGIPCYQWIQCVEGSGEAIINSQKITLRKGLGIFLPANTPHSYYGTTEHWITNCLCFGGLACEQILHALGLKEAGIYQFSSPEAIMKRYQEIHQLHINKPAHYQTIISKLLYDFLLDLSYDIKHVQISEAVTENKVLQMVLQYLTEHFDQPVSLEDLASLVNLRKEYLCTLFKSQMQQTIFQHLQVIRVAYARFYLSHYPEMTVKEIGLMCGFESSSYFCKVFKKLMKTSPEDYRRLH